VLALLDGRGDGYQEMQQLCADQEIVRKRLLKSGDFGFEMEDVNYLMIYLGKCLTAVNGTEIKKTAVGTRKKCNTCLRCSIVSERRRIGT